MTFQPVTRTEIDAERAQLQEHVDVDHGVLRRVWKLHQPEPGQHPDFYGECMQEMPCKTLKAFDVD